MNTMKSRIWLSYDLGLHGDFPGLYRFLDNQDAQEIGHSSATFMFETQAEDEEGFLRALETKIKEVMEVDKNTRLYVVCASKDQNGAITRVYGKFLNGRRKSNPWKGYGDSDAAEYDGE